MVVFKHGVFKTRKGLPSTIFGAFSAKNGAGFSLIELLVVITIIGILSGIVIVHMRSARLAAQAAKAKSEARQIYNAFASLEVDTNEWPGHKVPGEIETGGISNEICADGCTYDLTAPEAGLMATDGAYSNWGGPYLDYVMLDPWGNQYFFDSDYNLGGGTWAAVIGSYGPNGVGLNLYDSDDAFYIIVQE